MSAKVWDLVSLCYRSNEAARRGHTHRVVNEAPMRSLHWHFACRDQQLHQTHARLRRNDGNFSRLSELRDPLCRRRGNVAKIFYPGVRKSISGSQRRQCFRGLPAFWKNIAKRSDFLMTDQRMPGEKRMQFWSEPVNCIRGQFAF